MHKRLLTAAMCIVAAAFFSAAYAQEYRLPLHGQFSSHGAKGTLFIEDYRNNQNQVTVEATGLQPNSVYTVWLAKNDPKARLQGLGVKDYSFKTDATGSGRFIATVNEGELERWDVIEIAHHPNGNPSDLQNAQIALKGSLNRVYE